ncbi:Heterokaryon incompatibility protein 6, OR allele 12 [Colletotrichum chlorophyti]|uniref:Heterokaryon incompatibility protein 6, OR allele 12 n=1 Tax=Colletotrichum chlorophyti TaxID=708187 RepID=A0A1Q8RC62_9PEZI|nr:Heterokaryon incompatibility protein 6, OR allele 12 [Colletotrichum chlorophyti]
MSAYPYEPLLSPDSFRLLLLHPAASHDAELRGSLLNTTLSECDYDLIDPYTALSYFWGSPQRPCQLFLDGNLFPITQSLNDALRDLRDATRVRRVWADALCINQEDDPERSSQVRMMGRIYSTAHNTVIHLGLLTSEACHVLSLAPRKSCEVASNLTSTDTREVIAQAVGDLLSRAWFKRVWVLQELVLSRDPWVQCGNRRIRWTDFCHLLLVDLARAPRNEDGEAKLRVLADMNTSRVHGLRLPLHRAVQARRGLGATNPRDFVYANFGIINDLAIVNRYLQVDYSISVARTFAKVAQYMYDQLGIENLIYHTDAPSSHRISGLPSWAPDWTRGASYTMPMRKDNHLNHMKLIGIHHAFTAGNLPPVLGHIGFSVDTIDSVGCVMHSDDRLLPITAEYEQAIVDLTNMYRNGYASGDKFGTYRHVPLKGKEIQHENLCNIVGAVWAQFIKDRLSQTWLSDGGESTCRGDISFPDFFAQWLSSEATKQREFVGSETTGLLALLRNHFTRTKGQSELANRRLVSTRGGRCGVVPSAAKAGDIVAYLAGSHTAVVLRHTRGLGKQEQEVERALLALLRQPGHGVVSTVYQHNEEEFWRVPEQHDPHIEHYEIIGEGYLDGYVGWTLKSPPKTTEMRIFALH